MSPSAGALARIDGTTCIGCDIAGSGAKTEEFHKSSLDVMRGHILHDFVL